MHASARISMATFLKATIEGAKVAQPGKSAFDSASFPAAAQVSPILEQRLAASHATRTGQQPSLLILIAACWFLIFCAGTGKAQQFQVKGLLNIKQFSADGVIEVDHNESFEVAVSACEWHISASPCPNAGLNAVTNWEIGSEGSNTIYQVSYLIETRAIE